MNKKEIPLASLQALNRVNTQLLKLSENLDDLVIQTYNKDKFLIFQDSENDSQFKFEIIKLDSNNSTTIFRVEMSPSSNLKNEPIIKNLNEKEIINEFQKWVSWITAYNNIHLTPEDKFYKTYKDEYYDELKIVDDDANFSPFSEKQQLLLYEYLQRLESKLLEYETTKDVEEILNDTKLLKENLGHNTKNGVLKKLSSIFAKIRKSNTKHLKEIFDIAKKELIKAIINGGIETLPELFS